MRVGTLGVAKAVSVLMSPHPPCPHAPGRIRGNAGVALPVWNPSLEDKEDRVPGMCNGWDRVFLEGGRSSSGFPPLTLLTSRVLSVGHQARWPASWWLCWTCWHAAAFVPAELARNISCSACAQAWWCLHWDWCVAGGC